MLEPFMIATEPLGTWGPGPVPEPVGGWARLLDSVANDPQAVATIIAAFLGFLFGVLIKYGLDRRAERLRRESDRRILATALRAELLGLDAEFGDSIDAYEEMLNKKPEKEIIGGPYFFALMALPARRVWMAHLGRIGELKGFDPESLVQVHASFDSYDLFLEIIRQETGGQGVHRRVLQDSVNQLKKMRKATMEVCDPLIEQTKVGPSWWRRISRF